MNFAQCLRTANQLCAMSQIRRQCFFDIFVTKKREHGVHDTRCRRDGRRSTP